MPLFNAYITYTGWTEFDLAAARRPGLLLAHPGNMRVGYHYTHLLADLAKTRAMLLHLLRRAPTGVWVDLPSFITRTHGLNLQGVFWSPQAPVAAYWQGQPLDPQHLKAWRDFFGSYIEAVLTGPLHWQGAVELGYAHDQLVAFRLTELGAFLLLQQVELSGPAGGGRWPAPQLPARRRAAAPAPHGRPRVGQPAQPAGRGARGPQRPPRLRPHRRQRQRGLFGRLG